MARKRIVDKLLLFFCLCAFTLCGCQGEPESLPSTAVSPSSSAIPANMEAENEKVPTRFVPLQELPAQNGWRLRQLSLPEGMRCFDYPYLGDENSLNYLLDLTGEQAVSLREGPFPRIIGSSRAYAVDEEGIVWRWPYGRALNLGYPSIPLAEPTLETEPGPVKQYIRLGDERLNYSELYLFEDGSVWGRGLNANGRLGLAGADIANYNLRQLEGPTGIERIFMSEFAGLALDASGSVWHWGLSGREDQPHYLASHKLEGLPPIVDCQFQHNSIYLLDEQGQLWLWGADSFGLIPADIAGTANVFYRIIVGGSVYLQILYDWICLPLGEAMPIQSFRVGSSFLHLQGTESNRIYKLVLGQSTGHTLRFDTENRDTLIDWIENSRKSSQEPFLHIDDIAPLYGDTLLQGQITPALLIDKPYRDYLSDYRLCAAIDQEGYLYAAQYDDMLGEAHRIETPVPAHRLLGLSERGNGDIFTLLEDDTLLIVSKLPSPTS